MSPGTHSSGESLVDDCPGPLQRAADMVDQPSEENVLDLNLTKSEQRDVIQASEIFAHGLYEFHGLVACLKAPNRGIQIFWAIVLFLCLFMALAQIDIIIIQFTTQPAVTKLSIEVPREGIHLPAVTVCSTSPSHSFDMRRFIHDFTFDKKTLFDFQPRNNTDMHSMIGKYLLAGLGFQRLQQFETLGRSEIDKISFWVSGNFPSKLQDPENLLEELKTNYSIKCTDVFKKCIFGLKSVDCCNIFNPIVTLKRGLCFVTNPRLLQALAGEFGQLKMTLNRIGTDNQLSVELDEDVTPVPRMRYSQDINTRLSFRMGLKKYQEFSYEDQPCYAPEDMILRLFNSYSFMVCFYDLALHKIYGEPLHCDLAVMAIQDETPSGRRVCSFREAAFHFRNMTRLFDSGINAPDQKQINEHCKRPCSRIKYDINTFSKPINANNTFEVTIFYENLNYELVKEVPISSAISVMSQIGGTLGLWCGISIITVVQLLFYAATAVYWKVKHSREHRKKAKGAENSHIFH